MAEMITLLVFILILCTCILKDFSILLALFLGLICFIAYSLYKKYTFIQIGKMLLSGLMEAKTILVVFSLIGMLTALWRAGGTIPFIIYHTLSLIDSRFFVMFAFLLCSLVSSLTGTAFGTVSTMGIICMITGRALGIPAFHLGGAILSGVFVGDRCSPMSSSALLVSELTGSDIYTNIKNMVKTSYIPFIFTAAFYAASSYVATSSSVSTDRVAIFAENFNLNPWVILPALVIVALAICKYNIKVTIIWSIISGIVICMYFQGMSLSELFSCLIYGYHAENGQLARLIDGGGLVSMGNTMAIIAISSSYFGIFRNTKLLDGIKQWSNMIARRSSNFAAVLVVSIITAALSCNQTLATMLTYEITNNIVPDGKQLAIYLENTVILVSALIPWSIAAVFPLSTVGAPTSSIIYAVYLYAVPLWNLFISFMDYHRYKRAMEA
ncbi:MAG: Na+/H+ antiporter NhaC family protein [Tepidanaerobacteraceae bacterium]|jgi:NhaC family Na+:H+ antiporter|nr:hypothetical protein [Tepidanaerobacter sp.]